MEQLWDGCPYCDEILAFGHPFQLFDQFRGKLPNRLQARARVAKQFVAFVLVLVKVAVDLRFEELANRLGEASAVDPPSLARRPRDSDQRVVIRRRPLRQRPSLSR